MQRHGFEVPFDVDFRARGHGQSAANVWSRTLVPVDNEAKGERSVPVLDSPSEREAEAIYAGVARHKEVLHLLWRESFPAIGRKDC